MINYTIVIPILNEEKQLPYLIKTLKSYPSHIPIIFCDAGSTDRSLEILKECKIHNTTTIVAKKLSSPSVMRTILLCLEEVKTDYIWIHPSDANIIKSLQHMQMQLTNDYYIFYKKYTPTNFLLTIQEFFLNQVRIKHFKSFVWTNCPILKTSQLTETKDHCAGFLEDIILSDSLKARFSPSIHTSPVLISSRRYKANGTIQRLLGNLYIMFLYRLKLKTIPELKKIYYKA